MSELQPCATCTDPERMEEVAASVPKTKQKFGAIKTALDKNWEGVANIQKDLDEFAEGGTVTPVQKAVTQSRIERSQDTAMQWTLDITHCVDTVDDIIDGMAAINCQQACAAPASFCPRLDYFDARGPELRAAEAQIRAIGLGPLNGDV